MSDVAAVPAALSDRTRLEALAAYQIVNTPAEAAFDRLTELSASIFGVPLAAVTFMTEDQQWFKASVGTDLRVAPRDASFCQALFEVSAPDVLVVPDVLADDRFRGLAVVQGPPYVRFYAGAPLITPEGVRIGSLCLYDVTSRPDFSDRERTILRHLADQVMSELELRRALVSQRRERQLYAALMASAMDAMMVLDPQGYVIDWNPAAEALLGYTQAGAVGRELTDLMVPPECHAAHRATLTGVAEARDAQQRRVEMTALRQDGTRFTAEFTVAPFDLDGLMHYAISVRDVTEVQAARDAVNASRQLLMTVVESVPEAIYVKDTDCRYLLINAAGAAQIGRPAAEILGRTDDELFPLEAAAEARRRDSAVLSTCRPVTYEVTDTLSSGTQRTYWSTKLPLPGAQQRPAGLVGVSIDITDRTVAAHTIRTHNATLTGRVEQAQLEILDRLARAAEYRDDDTGEHMRRVGRTAAGLAQELGLSPVQVALMRQAAPLHDVGKIGVPDTLLLKPGRLTPEEFATVQTHALIGANILSGGHSPVVVLAEEIARTHHERWDGRGYPHGLNSQQIPISGRIVAVADVLDALTSERPYKRAWSLAAATAEICAQSGRQFDPQVVAALQRYLISAASADPEATP